MLIHFLFSHGLFHFAIVKGIWCCLDLDGIVYLATKMVKVVPIATISDRVAMNSVQMKNVHLKKPKIRKTLKNSKSKRQESWIVKSFKEFAANTALHGYNHIVREDATKWER